MTHNRITLASLTALAAISLPFAVEVRADEYERVNPVTHAATKKECGACHMAYQPAMLPADSWRALMDGLPNHFGEDASLDEAVRQDIEAYLVAHAGRGRGDEKTLRITETRWWVRAHEGEVRPGAYDDPKVKSKANCVACHRGAERGYFEDD